MSAVDHGPLRSVNVGPKRATTGVPTAAAICRGPVSPEIRSRARLAIANRSTMLVRGASSAESRDARTTFAGRPGRPHPDGGDLFLAGAPQHERPHAEPVMNLTREGAEPLRRPALVGPCRARIDQNEAQIGRASW